MQRSKVQKCLQKCLDNFEYVCGSAVMIWDHPKQIRSVPASDPGGSGSGAETGHVADEIAERDRTLMRRLCGRLGKL